ncbi:MAG TPA: hypothetical protein VFU63_13135, partial [Ktedonobacterales bacterium]|nr:hypothetical protein [Ktedonobacterales bacterium]
GAGVPYTIPIGNFPLSGITLATLTAIVLYQVLRDPITPEASEDAGVAIAPADSAAEPAGANTSAE